jgi:hypothetical protein
MTSVYRPIDDGDKAPNLHLNTLDQLIQTFTYVDDPGSTYKGTAPSSSIRNLQRGPNGDGLSQGFLICRSYMDKIKMKEGLITFLNQNAGISAPTKSNSNK